LQGAAQIEVGADADDRVEQGAQPLPAGHHLADPVEHLLQELVEPYSRQRGETERRRIDPVVRRTTFHHGSQTNAGGDSLKGSFHGFLLRAAPDARPAQQIAHPGLWSLRLVGPAR
jgi:hypothetical protein